MGSGDVQRHCEIAKEFNLHTSRPVLSDIHDTLISGARAQESESLDASLRLLALNVVDMANVKGMTIGDLGNNRVHFWQQTDKVGRLQIRDLTERTSINSHTEFNSLGQDFPGSPLAKTLPSNTGGVGSIPGQ